MSELSKAINEMRNMRESYDQIGAAAEAYNTGKTELAANINAKGVQASATETLPELAEKVSAIAQETYEIDGGEMYAKQLFGSLETPNYWNLYDVLAQLLSDGRLVSYGGILLAEFYRGYNSIALAGAGAGGAYVVSDMENGQFKMYTNDTTHTWNTEFDGKGNRWVAYCFADEYHDFQITDTNTSPRSIFIGRKVGTITSLVNGRVSQVVVPDGNELVSFNSAGHTQNFGKQLVLKNIQSIGSNALYSGGNIESIYIEADTWNGYLFEIGATEITTAVLKIKGNASSGGGYGLLGRVNLGVGNKIAFLSVSAQEIRGPLAGIGGPSSANSLELNIKAELLNTATNSYGLGGMINSVRKIRLFYFINDRARGFNIALSSYPQNNCTDIEVQNGWCKPLSISGFTALTEENIVNHILNRLGDNSGQSPLTITLGATNLAKLTAEEIAIATNKGFTLA